MASSLKVRFVPELAGVYRLSEIGGNDFAGAQARSSE
jgi:hypothetical protein